MDINSCESVSASKVLKEVLGKITKPVGNKEVSKSVKETIETYKYRAIIHAELVGECPDSCAIFWRQREKKSIYVETIYDCDNPPLLVIVRCKKDYDQYGG